MNIVDLISSKLQTSQQRLARAASCFALSGLFLFALSLFHPKPLTVILSMSVGHILGAIAVLLYLIAVVVDTHGAAKPKARTGPATSSDVQRDRNSDNQNDADAPS